MPDRQYWLVKTEPSTYSIQDLEGDRVTEWSGVRNYLARNYMREEMKGGDRVLVYHSSTDVLGIYGIAEVVGDPHPDSTQFEKDGPYYDPKSTPVDPTWWCVDLRHVETFAQPVRRDDMKERPELAEMKVLQRGVRHSVIPVAQEEYEAVLAMARE